MSLLYVSTTKSVMFQGKSEEFSNVYLLSGEGITTQGEGDRLIDAVAAAEKNVFGDVVKFVKGRAYTTLNLNSAVDDGVTYAVKPLTGIGGAATSPMYRECAFLIKWPLARKTKLFGLGRNRSLKKYLHTCTSFGQANDGEAAIGLSQRTALNDFVARLDAIVGVDLAAPDGSVPNGPHILHQYLEHRQFPRGRKEGGILG